MSEAKSRNSHRITAEKFVRAYVTSANLIEVAEKLGMSVSAVRTRGNYLRLRGVNLPVLHAHRPATLDAASLNKTCGLTVSSLTIANRDELLADLDAIEARVNQVRARLDDLAAALKKLAN